jgi:hypothetical protein
MGRDLLLGQFQTLAISPLSLPQEAACPKAGNLDNTVGTDEDLPRKQ